MSIASARLVPYVIPLREPWPSAEGPVTERRGCLLVLEDGDGLLGIGETAPFPGFGLETLASSVAALRLAARRLIGLPPEAYLEAIADLPRLAPIASAPAARHAADLALHDLAAQREGLSIARLLDRAAALSAVSANAAIPRVAPERAAAFARDAVAAGARTIKLKVGGAPLADDRARLRAVRDAVGSSIRIRIDANQAWSEAEAVEALQALREFELEYVEQPVAAGEIEAMARVRRATGVPIAADESVSNLAGARRVLAAEAADVLVLKPMVLGGLHAARAVAALARERGAGVVVTSLLESVVGRTGAVHLAASLGPSAYAHGVATGGALVRDLGDGPAMDAGHVAVPASSGLGVRPDEAILRSGTLVEAA
jgi:o-succinylbenzoate synthase